jgi:hypothetical protein
MPPSKGNWSWNRLFGNAIALVLTAVNPYFRTQSEATAVTGGRMSLRNEMT